MDESNQLESTPERQNSAENNGSNHNSEHSPLIGFSPSHDGCWTRVRESKRLVVVVVSVLMLLDVMLITCLEPVLPTMLNELEIIQSGNMTWSTWATSLFKPGGHLGNSTKDEEKVVYARFAPQIGFILGLKPGFEVVGNLLVGPLVDRIGHKLPLMVGSILYLVTSVMFALSVNYPMLVIARVLQAVSSSLSTVSGLALLAVTFRDEQERAQASAIAFGGLSFGLIVGFPFGAVVTQFCGRASPFLILGVLSALDGVLRLIVKSPACPRKYMDKDQHDFGVLWQLATNKYLGSILLADFFIHFALGTIFTTIPTFMQDTLHACLWQMAVVTFVATGMQFLTQYLCTTRVTRNPLHRWKFLFVSLVIFSLSLFIYPIIGATQFIYFAIAPEVVLRIALGIFTSTCFPTLNFLVDQFFNANYGAVNGLYTGLFNLGMFCGSQYAGQLYQLLGFDKLYFLCAFIVMASSVVGFVHRNFEDELDANSERVQQSIEDSIRNDHLGALLHSSASVSAL